MMDGGRVSSLNVGLGMGMGLLVRRSKFLRMFGKGEGMRIGGGGGGFMVLLGW